MCNLQPLPVPSSFVIPFGVHKGETLGEVFEHNPSFVDWLGSQDWLYFSTRLQINRFMDQGYVKETIKRLFWDEDLRCGGPLECDPRPAFIPSMQTTRRFNYGQPSWLKIEHGRDRSITQPEEPDFGYQWRAAGPQEPERDFLPPIHSPQPTAYRDPYRRPAAEATCDYTMVEEPSDVEIVADDPTDDSEEVLERPMSMLAWWDLLADLSNAIDFATDAEDLQARIAALDPRVKYLSEVLPADVLDGERARYRRAVEVFKTMGFINGFAKGMAELAAI